MVGTWRRAALGVAIVGLVTLAAPSASASGGWTVQTTVNPDAKQNQLDAVSCISTTVCTAVGSYGVNGNKTLAERWNGTSWTVETTLNPHPYGNDLDAVSCVSTTVCIAVGNTSNKTLAERWNGTRWFVQPTPTVANGGTSLGGVSCTSSSVCTAVGGGGLVERFTGTTWTVQSTPSLSGQFVVLNGVSCTSATACVAVGYSEGAGHFEALAERWDGSTWTIQPIPNPTGATESALFGVSCTSATACTAVGNDLTGHMLAERWDGSTWTIQPTPPSPGGAGAVVGVSCTSVTACVAVGLSDHVVNINMTLVERWNGTTWTIQPTPNPNKAGSSELSGVSCSTATACTAVGGWEPAGGSLDTFTLAEQQS